MEQLTFKAKNVSGKGRIEVSSAIVADGNGVETKISCEGTEIEVINITPDVNKDGKYTLGDLAIASRHYDMEKSKWNTNYNVDVIKDEKVDDMDLSTIVQAILKNEK